MKTMLNPAGRGQLRAESRAPTTATLTISPSTLQVAQEADATMSMDVWGCDYPELAAEAQEAASDENLPPTPLPLALLLQ
ncbi:hypothetical protein SAMN02745146_0245 [Hymenobacter daecheongensis DSM 21074]|uniref:Uncharacterized protein n=1 Tax=Hymenobacter daecheongensis DSM 21074 TaxID=1121955 RepID=A0A1M6MDX1_9BACT|nr:hypothetical protein [Hymenobacter daecheongensis]SHJ81662.1 hypothetical protein SAMN02745146_0245 [Hymenobacter daecheongensis DSM 21074]